MLLSPYPFQTNGIFHKATYNKGRMVHCIYRGVTGYNFPKNIAFLSMKMDFELANSADPDEMPQSGSSLFAKRPVKGFPSKGSVMFFCFQNITFERRSEKRVLRAF